MILDKINQFSEGKYTLDMPAAQIGTEYEEKCSDATAVIEALGITQRFISTCKSFSSHPRFQTAVRLEQTFFSAMPQPNLSISTDQHLAEHPPSAAPRR